MEKIKTKFSTFKSLKTLFVVFNSNEYSYTNKLLLELIKKFNFLGVKDIKIVGKDPLSNPFIIELVDVVRRLDFTTIEIYSENPNLNIFQKKLLARSNIYYIGCLSNESWQDKCLFSPITNHEEHYCNCREHSICINLRSEISFCPSSSLITKITNLNQLHSFFKDYHSVSESYRSSRETHRAGSLLLEPVKQLIRKNELVELIVDE